jgi:hypothetical protein
MNEQYPAPPELVARVIQAGQHSARLLLENGILYDHYIGGWLRGKNLWQLEGTENESVLDWNVGPYEPIKSTTTVRGTGLDPRGHFYSYYQESGYYSDRKLEPILPEQMNIQGAQNTIYLVRNRLRKASIQPPEF